MYQLNYHSKSVSDLQLQELDNILDTANAENAAKNISGCLIYHKGSFVQILEGKKEDVLQIFEKIKLDARHHSVTLLSENHVESRQFEAWNMAFHRPDSSNVELFVNNLLLLSKFSDWSSESLSAFWLTVRKILRGGNDS